MKRHSNIHFENKEVTLSEIRYAFEKKFKCPFRKKESLAWFGRTKKGKTLRAGKGSEGCSKR